jgi:hypothetical protein
MNTEQEIKQAERVTGKRQFALHDTERLISAARSVLKETQMFVWFDHEFITEIVNRLESALRAQQEREKPKPLTLDDLRKMEGKPVWTVTHGVEGSGRWEIVEFQKPNYDDREIMTLTNIAEGLYDCFADTYGKTWLAYDHEPKGCMGHPEGGEECR